MEILPIAWRGTPTHPCVLIDDEGVWCAVGFERARDLATSLDADAHPVHCRRPQSFGFVVIAANDDELGLQRGRGTPCEVVKESCTAIARCAQEQQDAQRSAKVRIGKRPAADLLCEKRRDRGTRSQPCRWRARPRLERCLHLLDQRDHPPHQPQHDESEEKHARGEHGERGYPGGAHPSRPSLRPNRWTAVRICRCAATSIRATTSRSATSNTATPPASLITG